MLKTLELENNFCFLLYLQKSWAWQKSATLGSLCC